MTTFIQSVEGDLSWIASSASSFVLSEIEKLGLEELGILKDALVRAITDALEGASLGSITADVLTILENENVAVFNAVRSDVIQALVGLGLVKP